MAAANQDVAGGNLSSAIEKMEAVHADTGSTRRHTDAARKKSDAQGGHMDAARELVEPARDE
ncbi:MAG TPA: hypothetical protein VGL65_03835 [Gemmatimonadales bacterium]|jgi:hypothetical protein